MVASGLVAFTIGNAAATCFLWVSGRALGFGTVVDLVDLVGYLFCLYGLWLMMPAERLADPGLKYDLGVLACGLFIFIEAWVLDPAVEGKHVGLALTVAAAYPVVDLVLLVAVAAVALSYRCFTRARQLILLAILLLLGTDISNTIVTTRGASAPWLNLGYVAATLALAGAAAQRSRDDLHQGEPLEATSLRRLGLLAFAMMLLVVSILTHYAIVGEINVIESGGAASLMILLTLRRLNLTVQAERAGRERLAAQHHFQAVLLEQAPGHVLVVGADGTNLFRDQAGRATEPHPASAGHWTDLVHPDDWQTAHDLLEDASEGRASAELRLRSGNTFRYAEVTATDARSDEIVGGFVLNVRDIEERREHEQRLYAQATSDVVTGLGNRFLLLTGLADELGVLAAGPQDSELVLFIGDLDHFKAVNDDLGHAAGDELLRSVGMRLRAHCPGALTVARLGGDEFAILMRRRPDDPPILDTAERLAQQVGLPVNISGRDIDPKISFGVATVSAADTSEEALRKADVALYAAKRSGEGVAVFDAALAAVTRRRLALQNDLRSALASGTLELLYQPVVADLEGRVVGYEALLRWHHREHGLIPPDEFIPYAEETGLINIIGRWVLHEACREAASWPAGTSVSIAVNVSPTQLKSPTFSSDVAAALRSTGLAPSRLILEITEEVFMDAAVTLRALTTVKALGVRIAIDDFGTGYSSLSYLQQLPLDQLKVDRSFISRLDEADTAALVGMLISLADNLNLDIVAEGVETLDQAQWLTRHAQLHMQGYLYSRPVPAAVLHRQLETGLANPIGHPATV
jgi:diguanylate cyclase (GGDEF)-like protein